MDDLSNLNFEDYFIALWGYPPFSWQKELAHRVLEKQESPWPEVIALPTAAGKTACMDIAVFSIAAQVGRLNQHLPLTAPRRIFFVIDRRVIVDEAFNRARKLSRKLAEAREGVLKNVADRLRLIAGGPTPLECFELRGGMHQSDAWAKTPLQPTIIASTVDQVGSRLLFRSYGPFLKNRAIQAGLIGNDSLIFLDEAHCSVPFMETLNAVTKYRKWADETLPLAFHTVTMSATPPVGATDVFFDESDEPRDSQHPLGKRQMASKPVEVITVLGAKGSKAVPEMARALAKAANSLAEGEKRAVVVFANRVATARETARLIGEKGKGDVVLLTGRMRPFDKEDVVRERLSLLSSERSPERSLEKPLFVVATQTLEVGADLDFDALVTECASLSALRQRFGRLNRMGRDIQTKAMILVRADQLENSEEDPVYGTAISETWKWMNTLTSQEGVLDFGISTLSSVLPCGEELSKLEVSPVHAPVMLPAHVDCLVQTAPEPLPSPGVAVFLHGAERATADVQVCWRADLDLSSVDSFTEVLTLCPPCSAECLSVPIWTLRRWLVGEDGNDQGSDVEGEVPGEELKQTSEKMRSCIRWRGLDDFECTSDPQKILPGDVVVIPSKTGGRESLGDFFCANGSNPVLDYGDRAYLQTRAKALLRLNPDVIDQWPDCREKQRFLTLAANAHKRWEEDSDGFVSDLREALDLLSQDETAPEWLRISASSLLRDSGWQRTLVLHPTGGAILRGRRLLEGQVKGECTFSDEDDSSASGTANVPLQEHLDGVKKRAEAYARGCGLSMELVDAIQNAAWFHDIGKADSRFQAMLRGGNRWLKGELLGKSERIPKSRSEYEKVRIAAGYPRGGRHELLSLRLIEKDLARFLKEERLSDLVKHLIESHHGHCRPFAPVVVEEKPVNVSYRIEGVLLETSSKTDLGQIGSGVGERFWGLTRQFGWWGLAFLEAVVRLADHRQSEAEEVKIGGTR